MNANTLNIYRERSNRLIYQRTKIKLDRKKEKEETQSTHTKIIISEKREGQTR